MGTREPGVIRDPAYAAAAGKCWMARNMGGRIGKVLADHPLEGCSFCEMEPEFLIDRISEFLRWAGLDNEDDYQPGRQPREVRAVVQAFQMTTPEEQQRLVRKAQGHPMSLRDDVERPSDLWR